MDNSFQEVSGKKFEAELWPTATARCWMWSVLLVYTVVALGVALFLPINGHTFAVILPAVFLWAGGCLLYASGNFSSNYSLALLNNNKLRCSTVWKVSEVSLRDVNTLVLHTSEHLSGDIEQKQTIRYGKILYHGGSISTGLLSHAEYSRLEKFFREVVAVNSHIELKMMNIPYSPSHWDSPAGG